MSSESDYEKMPSMESVEREYGKPFLMVHAFAVPDSESPSGFRSAVALIPNSSQPGVIENGKVNEALMLPLVLAITKSMIITLTDIGPKNGLPLSSLADVILSRIGVQDRRGNDEDSPDFDMRR